jgi:hypothetical protein
MSFSQYALKTSDNLYSSIPFIGISENFYQMIRDMQFSQYIELNESVRIHLIKLINDPKKYLYNRENHTTIIIYDFILNEINKDNKTISLTREYNGQDYELEFNLCFDNDKYSITLPNLYIK